MTREGSIYAVCGTFCRLLWVAINRGVVPGAGIEPARYFYRGILSPLRLPISPPWQKKIIVTLLLNSQYKWRRVPESNRRLRLCRPLHNHFANAPLTTQKKGNEFPFIKNLERETRFELATYTLARYRSTS